MSADQNMPDGWRALSQAPEHVLRDGLFVGGIGRATVEAFGDEGPWYANTMTPDGERRRLGACESHTAAAEWCERITGYRIAPPGPADREGGR